MKINADSLFVSTHLKESLHWIELVLREKACWILNKLDEWGKRKSIKLSWEETTIFPLLAEPWELIITAPGKVRMIKVRSEALFCGQLILPFPPMLTSQQIEKIVMSWYYRHAIIFFSERITLYASKLGMLQPQLRMSRAKNQWGSCDSRGIVYLN